MANFITSIRIICSVALLFCSPLSKTFYLLYIAAGVTDALDGPVARKTNSVSEFGSKLDTVADFVFVAVCLMKLIPVWELDIWIYIWVAIIAIIKLGHVVFAYVIQRKLVVVHSIMNKVVGALLFVLPFTTGFIEIKYSAIVVCILATFAAIQEVVFYHIQ